MTTMTTMTTPANDVRALGLCFVLLGSGCYVGPDDDGIDPIIQLSVQAPARVLADGQTLVDVLVTVDPDTARDQAITVTTSSGMLDFAADPQSNDARRTTVNNGGGSGQLRVPLRVGRTPGATLLSATLAGIRAEATLDLAVALPQTIELQPAQTSIVADGQNKLGLQLQAVAAPAAGFSDGLLALFDVCCGSAADHLASCADQAPLELPASALLAAGAVSVDALTRSWPSSTPSSHTLWLVSELRDPLGDPTQTLCGLPATGAIRAATAVEVRAKTP